MKLSLTKLAGEMPIVSDKLLPENAASYCRNARSEGGSLIPLNDLGAEFTVTGKTNQTRSAYKYPHNRSVWLTSDHEVDFVRGPIANDAWNRVYQTGDGVPKLSGSDVAGSSFRELGLIKPSISTVARTDGTTTVIPADKFKLDCAYYSTFVSSYGEESEPSDPSAIAERYDGLSMRITFGDNADPQAVSRRIYRTEGAGTYNFVTEVPIAFDYFDDNIDSDELGAPCGSESYNKPDPSMQGIASLGNGILMGFFGNTICFCEPYYPHAWPIEYQYSVPDIVTGISATSGGVLVVTEGDPWFLSGIHPAAISQTRIDQSFPCLNRRGLVDMGEYALYPTNDGLAYASTGGIEIISRKIINRSQWAALGISSFNAFRYRGSYLCFYTGGGFIFNPDAGLFFFDTNYAVRSGYYDSYSDELILVTEQAGVVSIRAFDQGDPTEIIWRSRQFILPARIGFSAMRIDAEGSAQVSITGSDNYNHIETITTDDGSRLPAGRPRELQIEVKSQARINSISLATSMSELL